MTDEKAKNAKQSQFSNGDFSKWYKDYHQHQLELYQQRLDDSQTELVWNAEAVVPGIAHVAAEAGVTPEAIALTMIALQLTRMNNK